MFLLRLFYYGGKGIWKTFVTCMSHHLYWILQYVYLWDNSFEVCFWDWEAGLWMGPDSGQRLVKGHQPPCLSFQPLESLSFEWVAVFSLGARASSARLLTVGVVGISVLLSCRGLDASCDWPSPSRGMFGSSVHHTRSVYKVSHKNSGSLATLCIPGAEYTPCIKGSRNKES